MVFGGHITINDATLCSPKNYIPLKERGMTDSSEDFQWFLVEGTSPGKIEPVEGGRWLVEFHGFIGCCQDKPSLIIPLLPCIKFLVVLIEIPFVFCTTADFE